MTARAFEERVVRTLEIIRHAIAVGDTIPGTDELGQRLGVNRKSVPRYLDALVERKKIKIRQEGRYRFITDRYVGKEQPMGVRVLSSPAFKPRLVETPKPAPAPKVARRKTDRRLWSDAETRVLEDGLRDGLTIRQIADQLGRPIWGVNNKAASLRQREFTVTKEPEPVRQARWTCQNCGTRSDAALDFGCAACRPMRSLAA
jgi:DNA-binding transcriptional MocR family regulator